MDIDTDIDRDIEINIIIAATNRNIIEIDMDTCIAVHRGYILTWEFPNFGDPNMDPQTVGVL